MVNFFEGIETEAPTECNKKSPGTETTLEATIRHSQEAEELQEKVLREPSFVFAYLDLVLFLNRLCPNNVNFIPKAIEQLIEEADPLELLKGPMPTYLQPCITSILQEKVDVTNYDPGDKNTEEIIKDLLKMLYETQEATFKYKVQLPFTDIIKALQDPTQSDSDLIPTLVYQLAEYSPNDKQRENLLEAYTYRQGEPMQKQIAEASKKKKKAEAEQKKRDQEKQRAWKEKEAQEQQKVKEAQAKLNT